MSKVFYLKEKRVLAYFNNQANSEFWDKHWKIDNLRERITSCNNDHLFIPLVQKYLSSGGKILEGGCGIGYLVHALSVNNYQAIGIDFAENTIQSIKQAVPRLDVRVGDVRHLAFEGKTFDGYISVGVIEHFWEGYEEIIVEMARVIRPGGYLFISFPYMSPLRVLKAAVYQYPNYKSNQVENIQQNFYQFALNSNIVIKDLEEVGFTLVESTPFDGIKGFKDEVKLFKPFLQKIYDGGNFFKMRHNLDKIFKPFAAHCVLLVMRKNV